MKQKSIAIAIYAAIILIGGIIGYIVAGSFISIFVSAIFAIALFVCSHFIWRGDRTAFSVARTLVFCLLLFFGYRFFLTFKIAPAGVMTLLSACLFCYLAFFKSK